MAVAFAQEEEFDFLETIMVTSRKRPETIVDVPLSVTALSGTDLQAADLDTIVDLANLTPGLDFESFNTFPGRQDSTPFIRGIVVDAGVPNPLAQPVGVFIDGIFISGGTKAIGIENIERVEVVKGPQSATFGRSTFAGALNYVTKDPAEELEGRVTALAATRDEYELTALISGPILGEKLRGQLSGRYSFNGGHYANTANPGEELGEEETYSIGGVLLFEPNSSWRTRARAYYSKINDGPAAVQLIGGDLNNFGPFPAEGQPIGGVNGGDESIFAGTLPSRPIGPIGLNTSAADFALVRDALIADDFISLGTDVLGQGFGLEISTFRASLDSTYEFENGVSVTAIIGYNTEESLNIYDSDLTTDQSFSQVNPRKFEDFSAEIRVQGEAFDEKLYWAIAGNFYDARFDNNFDFVFFEDGQPGSSLGSVSTAFSNPAIGANLGGTPDVGFFRDEVQNYGFSAQLSYEITDQITISYEGRYNVDDITDIANLITDEAAAQSQGLVSNEDTVTPSEGTFKNYLQRATIDFKPNQNNMIYFTYSEGNLPGGFNNAVLGLEQFQIDFINNEFGQISTTFDEETLRNFEIGYKGSVLDGRLNFALSGFLMRRSDETVVTTVQIPQNPELTDFESQSITLNAQSTRVLGIEAEGTWFVSESLNLASTIAFIDSQVTDFPEGAIAGGDLVDVFGLNADPLGQSAPRFARVQASFSATYEHQQSFDVFGVEWNPYARGDYFYTGKRYLTLLNVGESPSAHVINFRTGLRSENATIEFFVTNLTNEDAPTGANNTSDLSFNRGTFGPPGFGSPGVFNFGLEGTSIGLRDRRQFGLRATFDF
ncbi:MAG: TonB-dependent receptor [Pseudomonadota bacterium]